MSIALHTVLTIKYTDETDRAYGLGGMAVCMGMLERAHFIEELNLDADPDAGVVFTNEFFSIANQRFSARSVWEDNYKRFQIATSLLLANVMCRAMLNKREPISRELTDLLSADIAKEGRAWCDLENDEAYKVFRETFQYLNRAFRHPQVGQIVNELVSRLKAKRRLPTAEIEAIIEM